MRWIEAGLALALAGIAAGTGQTGTTGMQAPQTTPAPPAFTVVLDGAHGGSDTGARLRDDVLEKNITLKLAKHLRPLLTAQGIAVVMTRESDVNVPELNRAEMANHAQAAACLVIHATATGSGVHLFASSLLPQDGKVAGGALLPWATAQAGYVTQSLKLESELDAALTHADIPVTMGRAAVDPMNNLTCPAAAVEVAPLVAGKTTPEQPITDEEYEKKVVDALAAAIGSWRKDWTQP